MLLKLLMRFALVTLAENLGLVATTAGLMGGMAIGIAIFSGRMVNYMNGVYSAIPMISATFNSWVPLLPTNQQVPVTVVNNPEYQQSHRVPPSFVDT